ncbi:MAG: hypothetical protein IPK69_10400 [Phycisphaerales bacterium]|nr:MAG: hypothetical protein IPK69_10400 [Phycisphaerales bacterium]
MTTTDIETPKPMRKRRIILKLFLALVIVIVALIALLPTIAGSFAPGAIASAAAPAINGTLKVDKVSLSWFGGQSIGPVTINDDKGAKVADLTISTSKGLLGLMGADHGTITISGTADVVREADGTTNLQRLVKSNSASSSTPTGSGSTPSYQGQTTLPAKTAITLAIDALNITFTDKALSTPISASLNNLRGAISATVGGDATIKLDAEAKESTSTPSPVAIDVKIQNWSDAAGRVTPDAARIDAKINVPSFPVALADAFVTLPEGVAPNGLSAALGKTASLDLKALGNAKGANVVLDFHTGTSANDARLALSGTLDLANGSLTATTPIIARAKGETLRDLVPSLEKSIIDSGATIDAMPDVTLTIASLSVATPKNGLGTAPLDFRGAKAQITLETTAIAGSVKLDPNAPAKPFAVEPLRASVATADLAGGVTIKANSSAKLANDSAGVLGIDLIVGGLLNDKGAPTGGLPRSISGTAALTNVATAIAQPFLGATGLDLPRDLGPTLNASLQARTNAAAANANSTALPPTDLTISVDCRELKLDAPLRLENELLTGVSKKPVKLDIEHLGAIASRLIPASAGWKIEGLAGGPGWATMLVHDLRVPVGKPVVGNAAATLGMSFGGLAAIPPSSTGTRAEPVALNQLSLAATLHNDDAPTFKITQCDFGYIGVPFTIEADMVIQGLFARTESGVQLTPAGARPVGTFKLKDIPSRLAAVFNTPSTDGTPTRDLGELAMAALGPKVNVIVTGSAPAGSNAVDLALDVNSDNATWTTRLAATSREISLTSASGDLRVTPHAFDTLTKPATPQLNEAPRPRLVEDARFHVAIEPLVVKLNDDKSPNLASSGALALKLSSPSPLVVETKVGENMQTIGMQGLGVEARVPLVALAESGAPATIRATLAAALKDTAGADLGTLSGEFTGPMLAAKPAGEMKGILRADRLSTPFVDAIAGQNGLLVGAIGSAITLNIESDLRPPTNAAPGAPYEFAAARLTASASATADRLSTPKPFRINIEESTITLAEPASVRLTPDPAWATAFLKPKANEADSKKPANTKTPAEPMLTLTEIAPIDIAIPLLTLSKSSDETGGPLKPGVFSAAVDVTMPSVAATTSDGRPLTLTDLKTTIRAGRADASPGPDAASVKLTIASATSGDAAPAQNLHAETILSMLSDANGKVTMERALVDAQADLAAVPTSILDAIAAQDGLLADALGPTTALKATIVQFPLDPKANTTAKGTLDVDFDSPRAKAKLAGNVGDSVLTCAQPVEASILEITESLGGRLVKGLPLVGSLKKSPQDAPALIRAENLALPLNGDLSKLNGTLTISPGDAQFAASSYFAKALSFVGAHPEGFVGRKLAPLSLTVTNGVAAYPKYKLPLGEFTIETEGSFNLADNSVDVVTWIPLGALTDEAAGLFKLNTGLGAAAGRAIPGLENATMMPFRTRGPATNPSTKPDLELFAKDVVKSLNPAEKVDDLLKGIPKIFK